MKKHQREAILISFLNKKEKYRKLAEYFIQMIRDDLSSPKESLHTIIYRIKDELRLIEKIIGLNKELEAGVPLITEKNYQAGVGDLLGVRIICLRLSDVEKVEAYLKLLSEEKILNFVKGPDRKRSFILPVAPGDAIPDEFRKRYSGYSSVHYQVKLDENSDAPAGLMNFSFELQLRTILEEAWSEIDHKYRYVHSRIGVNIPEYIHNGFYNLSAYLQVAANQAEYLCRLTDAYSLIKNPKMDRKSDLPCGNGIDSIAIENEENHRKLSMSEIETTIEEILGIKVKLRTLIYIEKRLEKLNLGETQGKSLQRLFSKSRLLEFRTISQEILKIEPFVNAKGRNIDVINALNYAIFHQLQGKKVAQEGLKVVLRWRKNRLNL